MASDHLYVICQSRKRPAYLAFTIDHALIDGKGVLRLTQALLKSDTIQDLPYEDFCTFLPLADHIRERPSLYTIIKEIFKAFVAPRLPVLIRQWPWLSTHFPYNATAASTGVSMALLFLQYRPGYNQESQIARQTTWREHA